METENMNSTMKLLYELLEFLPANLKDENTIIRLDLDHKTPSGTLKLVVITKGRYYHYWIDDIDFDDYPKLFQFVLDHIMKDPDLNLDSQ
jgi:uncharacterized protein YegJ (DUF2314 family)